MSDSNNQVKGQKTRIFVRESLRQGESVTIDEAYAHYLLHVMRLGHGDELVIFNGMDGEWLGRLDITGKRSATVSPVSLLRSQEAGCDIWLLFAPVKRTRIDCLVEKTTELGVSDLFPVYTERTMVERVREDRLVAIAREAAEQSERLDMPIIHAPRPLSSILSGWPGDRILFHLDETGGGKPIGDAISAHKTGRVAFLVGPEGGFTAMEIATLARLPFVRAVGLGPRILRADTAAIAALSCYQALLGDWGRMPDFSFQG